MSIENHGCCFFHACSFRVQDRSASTSATRLELSKRRDDPPFQCAQLHLFSRPRLFRGGGGGGGIGERLLGGSLGRPTGAMALARLGRGGRLKKRHVGRTIGPACPLHKHIYV